MSVSREIRNRARRKIRRDVMRTNKNAFRGLTIYQQYAVKKGYPCKVKGVR